MLGAAKNPVSLQSKHGLAYNLDESGVGCLQNCVQAKARKRRREKRLKRGEGEKKTEVNSRNFPPSLKISVLELPF